MGPRRPRAWYVQEVVDERCQELRVPLDHREKGL